MICKKHKGYLILGILAILLCLGYIASKFIKPGPYSVPGIYEFIFLVCITPSFSIIYGAVSYILTKQAVIPNLVFAVSFNVFLAVTTFTSDFFEETIESLPVGIIIFIITAIQFKGQDKWVKTIE